MAGSREVMTVAEGDVSRPSAPPWASAVRRGHAWAGFRIATLISLRRVPQVKSMQESRRELLFRRL